MSTENGRGRQRRRRLLLLPPEDNFEGRSGCSKEPLLLHNQPPPNDDEASSTTMTCFPSSSDTNERRGRRRKEASPPITRKLPHFSIFSFNPRSSLYLLLSILSWRHILFIIFAICWLAGGSLAAPSTDRHEKQPTLQILDGYVHDNYSNGSSSNPSFQEISRNAFLSLKGTPVEARFRLGTAYQLESSEKHSENHVTNVEHQAHVDHLTRHHRKKNRKPVGKLKKLETDEEGDTVLEGRKHALLQLANPEALNMNQRCDGQKFKQRIRVDGCLTKVVVNRLCHGTCASIFIPRMHSKKLKAAFRSCAACAPADYDYVDITLDCPGRNPPTATKTIVKVKSCKCREVRISPI